MSAPLLTAFNDHFIDFINDVQSVFPKDSDILTAKNSLAFIRKTNPKLIIKIWNSCIVGKYKSVIEEGNIDFFVNKDYSDDLQTSENGGAIMQAIDRLRTPIKNMSKENQDKTMKYIQNLTKLAYMFEQSSK
jgi:hypothetical protein